MCLPYSHLPQTKTQQSFLNLQSPLDSRGSSSSPPQNSTVAAARTNSREGGQCASGTSSRLRKINVWFLLPPGGQERLQQASPPVKISGIHYKFSDDQSFSCFRDRFKTFCFFALHTVGIKSSLRRPSAPATSSSSSSSSWSGRRSEDLSATASKSQDNPVNQESSRSSSPVRHSHHFFFLFSGLTDLHKH